MGRLAFMETTASPTTLARSTPTPKPGGAGTTKRPHLSPDGSSRTQHAQASAAPRATRRLRDPPPGERRHRMSGRKKSHHMTTIVPGHRTALGPHLRDLQVILASAPARAAVIVACAIPAGTSGPPLHVHAACDEIFFILSGELLVHADDHVATIREGGLVHVSCGMPHVRDDTRHSGALPGAVHHTRPDRMTAALASRHRPRQHPQLRRRFLREPESARSRTITPVPAGIQPEHACARIAGQRHTT